MLRVFRMTNFILRWKIYLGISYNWSQQIYTETTFCCVFTAGYWPNVPTSCRVTLQALAQLTSYQIRKTAGCACAGNAGKCCFFSAADFNVNSWLAIPACITARMWRTCRNSCRGRLPAVAGKTAFPANAHPQFYVWGKRPMLAKQPSGMMT